jgi:hypothetical protein
VTWISPPPALLLPLGVVDEFPDEQAARPSAATAKRPTVRWVRLPFFRFRFIPSPMLDGNSSSGGAVISGCLVPTNC